MANELAQFKNLNLFLLVQTFTTGAQWLSGLTILEMVVAPVVKALALHGRVSFHHSPQLLPT